MFRAISLAFLGCFSKLLPARFLIKRAGKWQYSYHSHIMHVLGYCFAGHTLFTMVPPPARAQVVLSAFEQQALLAFNPNAKALSSLTLTGSVVWTAGSLKENGTVVLKAGSDGSTLETWTLPTQSHTYAATSWNVNRSCTSTTPKGVISTSSDPNCLRSLAWFAPWVGFTLLSNAVVLASDTTQANDKTRACSRYLRASTMRAKLRKPMKSTSSFSKREKILRKPLSLRNSRSISLRFL